MGEEELGERLSAVRAFCTVVSRGEDAGLEDEPLMRSLIKVLDAPHAALRTAGLRALRLACATPARWAWVARLRLDRRVLRSLENAAAALDERVQALKFVRHACSSSERARLPHIFARALVRLADEPGDALRMHALE